MCGIVNRELGVGPMQGLQTNKLNLHRRELSREAFELPVLLAQLDGELVGLHIKRGRLQLGFYQLLLDGVIRHSQLLHLRLQVLVLSLTILELVLHLIHFFVIGPRVYVLLIFSGA